MCSKGLLSSEVTPAYIYESNIHVSNILSTLNEQRKYGLLCDITIIVQGVEFKAHKAILASCSSYFNRIITDPDNVSHNIVLELSSISKMGMESLLEFAYTSKLAVTFSNIDDVICAAHELEFKNIEFSCLNYLKQQLMSGTSASCFLNSQEASALCGNSTISRKVEALKADNAGESFFAGKYIPKCEKELPKNKECPLLAKFRPAAKKKENPSNRQPCQKYQCDMNDKKSDICDQISQEEHRAMIKQILDKHGLEAATVDEKLLEVGATETTSEFTFPACSPLQVRMSCPGSGGEKKRCVSGYSSSIYNSDSEGSGDEAESGACSMSTSTCGKSRKQPAIKLPFTMDEITSMPRSELQELLTRNSNLTQKQICAIHEIRRRGKNRIAAQRCRKRKMECIRSLVAEIEVLRADHATLMNERRDAREQAIKLSDKFRVRCEKFFKCDKKKKALHKFCGSSNSETAPLTAENTLNPDEMAAQNFKEHAERAYELCSRLKEAPCNDLPPPTPSVVTSECTIWNAPGLSPSDAELAGACDAGDSSDAGSIFQACSPTSSIIESTSAMSPSQGLSEFGNIHISPPGRNAETRTVSASSSRSSVLLHTRNIENRGKPSRASPSLNTMYPGFNAVQTQPMMVSQTEMLPSSNNQLPNSIEVNDITMN